MTLGKNWGAGLAVVCSIALAGACTPDRKYDKVGEGGDSSGGAASAGSGGSAGSAAQSGGSAVGGGSGTGPTAACEPGNAMPCWESADGVPFEGEPPTGQSTCHAGERKCQGDGSWSACIGAVGPEALDSCDAGNDANCNGAPNEGCSCTDGEKRACGSDVGNCVQGEQTCDAAGWGPCVGEVGQSGPDGCEPGDDSDCNDIANEGCVCKNGETMQCGTDVGPCEFGSKTCVNGVWPDECTGGVAAATKDSCEPGNDANCNSTANEGCGCTGTGPRACGLIKGACKEGVQMCTGGVLGSCSVTPTTNDTCFAANDANDTNCNGNFRDGCTCVATDAPQKCPDANGCGTQTCNGATGKWNACVGNGTSLRCNPTATDNRQICAASGVWTNNLCPSGSACRGSGTCKLLNEQPCNAAADCDSGACNTFYVDADGDGYTVENPTSKKFCGTVKSGHVATGSSKGSNDCNDAVAAINVLAAEVCDGADNDCDKAIDTADGLPLKNATVEVGDTTHARSQIDIAWAAEKSVYGLVWHDEGGNTDTWFTALNQAGVQQVAPLVAGTESIGNDMHVAWGTDNFGFAWFDGVLKFRTIGSNGSLGVVRTVFDQSYYANPHVGRIPGGNWGVTYIAYDSDGNGLVGAKTISATGVVGAHVPITTVTSNYGLLVGTSAGFVTTVEIQSTKAADSTFYSSTFGNPANVTVSGLSPVMGAGVDGFGIAVMKTGAKPEFYSYDSAGNAKCGPVPFADTNFRPSDLVGTANGYVIVSTGTGAIRAQHIKNDCELGPLFTVDTPTSSTHTRISAGTLGYGVVYIDASAKAKRRFFGPKFCD